MNSRQLKQGLVPTPEYERSHTYHTLRQFPELCRTLNDMQLINLRSKKKMNCSTKNRPNIQKSTHRLDQLSKSSLDEINAMTDFRKILLENRRKLQNSSVGSFSSLPSIEDRELTNIDHADAADRKLTKVSVSFDSQSYHSHLAGFTGALTKKELEVQLRRCLNINLKQAELDALFLRMDADNSQLIDGVEFIRYFFNLGIEARGKQQVEAARLREKRQQDLKRGLHDEELRIKEWESSQISVFTQEDTATAMKKLEETAFIWDPSNHIECLYVNGFEAYLTPYHFKQQLDKSFGICLTGAETGALIKEFSTRDGEYSIDGYLFLKRFTALRQKTWKDYVKSRSKFGDKKDRVLSMGQQTDILPKLLGR